jgi:flagellar biosynthetic protein FliO
MGNPIEPLQWLSMLGSFVLVLALLGATLWVLRRMGGRGTRIQGRRLAIVESVWLGPRQRLALIRVDHQELLVAMSQQQINLLTHLGPVQESSDEAAPVVGDAPAPPADPAVTARFRDAMKALTQRLPRGEK